MHAPIFNLVDTTGFAPVLRYDVVQFLRYSKISVVTFAFSGATILSPVVPLLDAPIGVI